MYFSGLDEAIVLPEHISLQLNSMCLTLKGTQQQESAIKYNKNATTSQVKRSLCYL